MAARPNAWMAYGLQDVVQQRRMIDESDADETFKRVLGVKLDAMLGLCETLHCRRMRLLEYFGQAATPCGNCDTCLSPPVSFDATVMVQKLLSTVYRVEQRFGAVHVLDVLRGVDSDKIKQWRHDQLSTFGIGNASSEAEWRAILRQVIALGLLTVDYDAYNALKLTDAARPVLTGKQQVQLRQYQKPVKTTRASSKSKGFAESGLSAAEQLIFEKLRWWRVETAREHNVPAYVIFNDATMREIARTQPDVAGRSARRQRRRREKAGKLRRGNHRADCRVPVTAPSWNHAVLTGTEISNNPPPPEWFGSGPRRELPFAFPHSVDALNSRFRSPPPA